MKKTKHLFGGVILQVLIIRNMSIKDTREYVESKTPVEEHKYLGWFWDIATKKFYRWNDFPGRKYGIINGNS